MTDTNNHEKFIIESLISNKDLFTKCYSILKYEYFDPAYQNSMKFILEYTDQYNALPVPDLIEAETGQSFLLKNITKDLFEYTTTEVEKFCRREAFRIVLGQAIKEIHEPDGGKLDLCIEEMKKAVLLSLDKDLGLDYFDDPKERLERMTKSQAFQTTGYKELDYLLGGGLVEGQLIVFSGNSGTGKSMTLSNIGVNLLEKGLDVLYISLELSEELISIRMDGLIDEHDLVNWKMFVDNTITTLSSCKESGYGNLYIKYMNSGSTANHVKSYLKEFEIQNGYVPKVLLLDYLDIAGANSYKGADNVSIKDKYVSEEFRNLANEYGMYLLSASQQNRGAIGIDVPDQSHIAGGLTKANTSDFWFSIIATDDMKADGVVKYHCIKARSSAGVGKSATLSWNNSTGRIKNLDEGRKPINNLFSNKTEIKREKNGIIQHSNGEFNSKLVNLTKI